MSTSCKDYPKYHAYCIKCSKVKEFIPDKVKILDPWKKEIRIRGPCKECNNVLYRIMNRFMVEKDIEEGGIVIFLLQYSS